MHRSEVAQRHQRRKMTPFSYGLVSIQALLPAIAIPSLFPEELQFMYGTKEACLRVRTGTE